MNFYALDQLIVKLIFKTSKAGFTMEICLFENIFLLFLLLVKTLEKFFNKKYSS